MNLFRFDSASAHQLARLGMSLPRVAFQDERIDHLTLNTYRRTLLQVKAVDDLVTRAQTDLVNKPGARGYLIVDFSSWSQCEIAGDDLRLPTAICSLVGVPFRLVKRLGLWQVLGVDLGIEANRFGGIGHNPFHIDVVNSTRPPAYVCLFCIREDPAGGGETIISNLQHLVKELNNDERVLLSHPAYHEGQFFGITGAGEQLNPFPVLEPTEEQLTLVRYTGKIRTDNLNQAQRRALEKVDEILRKNRETFLLRSGQLIILNQLIVAHGRLALGRGQCHIPIHRRRYLRQTYMHSSH